MMLVVEQCGGYAGIMATITETLRTTIKTCGRSRYAIAKASGVDEAMLCRFMQGLDLRGETINRLAEHFGLELRPKARTRKAAK